jgi:ABC-2 type transport system ATP-binding protein
MTIEGQLVKETMLDLQAASLDFGNGAGVFDLTFSLPSRKILALIGPSGSGKTTTMRLLTGIYNPTGGQVRVFGKDPSDFDYTDKSRIGYIPQHFLLYQNLSVEENLNFMGGMYGTSPQEHREKMDQLLVFFELDSVRKRLGRHLSGGMQRRLMLSGALLHDPDLIFADEPTAGIDPVLRQRTWEYFRKLRDQGASILVTTQYVGEAAFCDLVAVMRKGRLIILDTPQELRRKAMGGEIIHIQVDHENVFHVMEFLDKLPRIIKVEQVDSQKDGIFVYVEDARKEIPSLVGALIGKLEITPNTVEPYYPPFDEVFVRLLKQREVA